MTPTEHIYSLASAMDIAIDWWESRNIEQLGRSAWGGTAFARGCLANPIPSKPCVQIPRPWRNLGAYITGLHEFGHHALGHCSNPSYRFYRRHIIAAEIAAIEFSFSESLVPITEYMLKVQHQAVAVYKGWYPYSVTRYTRRREKEIFGGIIGPMTLNGILIAG